MNAYHSLLALSLFTLSSSTGSSAGPGGKVLFPPQLPDGQSIVTDSSPAFLEAPATISPAVRIATAPPTIDFMFYPGQTYAGNPWSNWGDSLAVNGKYYASIGDHLAPGGNAFVYEYDPAVRMMRQLVDVRKVLGLPEGHYTPGKIHGRLDLGEDGWIYFSTHRGSTRVTTDEFHYEGDWILRCHPDDGRAEVVARGPVPRHCIPCSVLDPRRLIFYGGTAPGSAADGDGPHFFAYDVRAKKRLYSGPDGPARAMMFAESTGRIYFTPGTKGESALMKYDPVVGGAPVEIDAEIGLRATTGETPDGIIYAMSSGQGDAKAMLYAFHTATEQVENLGPASVGTQDYITSIDADATGRFLYYVPGAHGGSEKDGAPVVQFDTRSRTKKVIAFLHPFYAEKYGCTLKGTFSSAIDPAGDKLYVTWNNSRGGKAWDSCVLTVIHIPASERAEGAGK